MSARMLYTTGEEAHAGDRVRYQDTYATVVFVSDGESEEFAPGYEDYSGSDAGFIISDDDGAVTSLGEPTDLVTFIERG